MHERFRGHAAPGFALLAIVILGTTPGCGSDRNGVDAGRPDAVDDVPPAPDSGHADARDVPDADARDADELSPPDATDATGPDAGPVDAGPRTRPALAVRGPTLPAEVVPCPVVAETACRSGTVHECAVFDATGGTFPDEPPAFLRRVLQMDRYMDRHHVVDSGMLSVHTTTGMAPGTPEASWASAEAFKTYADWGDAAFYLGMHLTGAAHRYAVTGTDADYARMVDLVDRQLRNWRATGIPGTMVRSVAAMLDEGVAVPPGYPQWNLRPFKERTNHVLYAVDPVRHDLFPAYYHQGVTLDDDTHLATTPLMEGSPSLDACSGALVGLQMAFDLLRPEQAPLRDEIATAVSCKLKRLKKMRVRNLNASPLGQLLAGYLAGASGYHPSPGDLDLSTVDTMIGYVQETPPPDDPGDFRYDCPDDLPRDVDPAWDWDAAGDEILGQVLDLADRMSGQGDRPIDFVYLVSHRGGDAIYLYDYAAFATHATGDARYLEWADAALTDEADGLRVVDTAGSFFLNPYCGQWIGGDLSHPVMYATLMRLADDDPIAVAHRRTMKKEFRDKLLANDNNAYFAMTYGAVGDRSADPDLPAFAAWGASELAAYVQHPEHPLDPKRNYGTNFVDDPLPPPWEPSPPTADEIAECEAGLPELGLPGPGVHKDFQVLSRAPLPVAKRVPHDLIWHFSPFNLKREYGDGEGTHQMYFVDLATPYWIGRYHGLIDGGEGMVLAWRDTGAACPAGEEAR